MELTVTKNKYVKLFGVVLTLGVLMGMTCVESGADIYTDEAAIGAFMITAIVLVIMATALLPTIMTQSTALSTNCTEQGQTTLATLVDLWPLLIGIGVVISIIAFAI